MPVLDLAHSPLAPGVSPVRIHYRETGAGSPILFLHGGWGYEIYPFDRTMAVLASHHRMVIPDRTGYGRSGAIDTLPPDFHRLAMAETRAVIGALRLDRPVVWGHSDGAVIALLLALDSPDAVGGVILEATHVYRRKPRSQAFFQAVVDDPRSLGESAIAVLARDHGPRWVQLVRLHSCAWLQIAVDAASETADFYDGRLNEMTVPALVLHGGRDPRTEPGELAELEGGIRDLRGFAILPEAGHSPHSERATADEAAQLALRFMAGT